MFAPPHSPRFLQHLRKPVHAKALSDTVDAPYLAHTVGNNHQVLHPSPQTNDALMRGSFSLRNLRPGLSLHCTDVVHLQDLFTSYTNEEACIKVLLRLEGNALVTIGDTQVDIHTAQAGIDRAQGAILAVPRNTQLRRSCSAGTRQRMVVVTLSQDWFAACNLNSVWRPDTPFMQHWEPSPRAIGLAERLIAPPLPGDHLHTLQQESKTLELIAEALAQCTAQAVRADVRLSQTAAERIRRLQALLDSGQADHSTMDDIAQNMGCNATTLQQQFRAVHQKPIFEYLRDVRLQRAANALQLEGISVAQAAELAGYTSQANFSTAFKRKFGLQPKQYRTR